MSDYSSNNKRLAKNTIYLYLRMVLTMAIGLYTSRVVLKTLGVSDYGVYNVTGGLITMLTYVNTILSGGTSRFLTIALGKNNLEKLKTTFSTTVTLSIVSALIVLVLGETLGLWFINAKLNIDPQRMDAANWVYQCALLSSMFTITQTPYSASLISHERMNVYAYMSIFDVIMKLLIVYLLMVFDYDKLILYAILMLVVNILDVLIYRWYCIRHFEECSMNLGFDRTLFINMFSYSSWNMVGTLSVVLIDQGINMMINIFYGTVVNAARGIATQVNGVVRQLYSSFQTPCRPQVMKYYASGNLYEMQALICNNSRYCSYLLLCVIIPLSVNIKKLLEIWLVEVPEYTVGFVRCIFVVSFINAMIDPLLMGIHAVGKVKKVNIITALINLSVFASSYLLFRSGASPISCYIPLIISCFINIILYLTLINKEIKFDYKVFISKSVLPVFRFSLLCTACSILVYTIMPETIVGCLFSCILSGLLIAIVIFLFGLPKNLKKMIILKMYKYIRLTNGTK